MTSSHADTPLFLLASEKLHNYPLEMLTLQISQISVTLLSHNTDFAHEVQITIDFQHSL